MSLGTRKQARERDREDGEAADPSSTTAGSGGTGASASASSEGVVFALCLDSLLGTSARALTHTMTQAQAQSSTGDATGGDELGAAAADGVNEKLNLHVSRPIKLDSPLFQFAQVCY